MLCTVSRSEFVCPADFPLTVPQRLCLNTLHPSRNAVAVVQVYPRAAELLWSQSLKLSSVSHPSCLSLIRYGSPLSHHQNRSCTQSSSPLFRLAFSALVFLQFLIYALASLVLLVSSIGTRSVCTDANWRRCGQLGPWVRVESPCFLISLAGLVLSGHFRSRVSSVLLATSTFVVRP